MIDRSVAIERRGGELAIEWPSDQAHVLMTGPAAEVYTGRFPLEGSETPQGG